MNKIMLMLLTITMSAHAFGGWINADSMAVGNDVTNTFGGMATLNWVNKEQGQPTDISSLIVNQANTEFPGNHSKYFGASDGNSGTSNLTNLQDSLYWPESYPDENLVYSAIAITFTQPVLSFGFEAENFNSDEQYAFLFTPQGDLIRRETIIPMGITGDFGVPIWGYKHTFELTNQNVGSIVLGSWSSATYYSDFNIEAPVPEPSSLLMLALGLTLLGFKQIKKTGRLRC